jgi:hypothetical protein
MGHRGRQVGSDSERGWGWRRVVWEEREEEGDGWIRSLGNAIKELGVWRGCAKDWEV